MTRRPVRILWALIGACLVVGAVVSITFWLQPDLASRFGQLKEFSALLDIAAVMFWFLVFAVYWSRHPDD